MRTEPANRENNSFELQDVKELNDILNKSTEAWKIMSDMWSRILKLSAKYESLQLTAALEHAYEAFSQDINGMRDHIKLSLGRI
jgi:hypothetical protein